MVRPINKDAPTIELVSARKMADLRRESGVRRNVGFPWHADNTVRRETQATTDHIFQCNAGGLQNGQEGTLFHLFAEHALQPAEKTKIRQCLREDTLELKKKGTVHGLIAGGHDYKFKKPVLESAFEMDARYGNILDYSRNNSKRLESFLEKEMEKAGVDDISIIWGRRHQGVTGPANLFQSAGSNTWYLNARLEDEGEEKDILSLTELRRAFSRIQLAEGVRLVTEEGVYTARDLREPNPFKRAIGRLL